MISAVQIFNFKAFRETPYIELKPGINLIMGKNNVGKSAFLEALTLNFPNKPHYGITHPSSHGNSRMEVYFGVDKTELDQFMRKDDQLTLIQSRDLKESAEDVLNRYLQWIQIKEERAILRFEVESGGNASGYKIDVFGLYRPAPPDHRNSYKVYVYKDNSPASNQNLKLTQFPPFNMFPILKNRIYKFDAERSNIGRCAFGPKIVLNTNASNLPEVLANLSRNSSRYERFMSYVSNVLPGVKWISVRNLKTSTTEAELELEVWMIPKETESVELAIPLRECGTGIGQVLAMLYVVFTSTESRTIIIDEPQSFLHPSAIRALLQVFKQFDHHQYILATHSSLILSASSPATVLHFSHDGNEAHVKKVENFNSTKNLLDEIGVRLSDVLGIDQAFWVEGSTETQCFPMILEKVLDCDLVGINFLPIVNTGDFHQKRKQRIELVFEIYRRLSKSQAMFTKAIGFMFDSELLTDADQLDLKKLASPIPVAFLPRRTYENYLLHPEAIASVLNSEEKPITREEVSQWIHDKKSDGSYLPNEDNNSSWEEKVDGANLLKDLFLTISEHRMHYIKTEHSPLLTKWLIENDKDFLRELAEFIRDFINDC